MMKEQTSTRRLVRLTALSFGGSLLLLYLVISLISPLRQLGQANRSLPQMDPAGVMEEISGDALQAKIRNVCLTARINMAAGDSFGLVILPEDSLIHLEIKGLSVHQARIGQYRADPFLSRLEPAALVALLADPWTVRKSYSSIEKEPILRVAAPKDTLEAARSAVSQDTSDTRPVFFLLELENGIDLLIGQSEMHLPGARKRYQSFMLGYRARIFFRNAGEMIRLRVPEYRPLIVIRIPRKDARVIYRSLPAHPRVVFFSPVQHR